MAYALASSEDIEMEEPKTYQEALKRKDWKLWNGAADEEMESLKNNHTWDYAERPKDHKVIGNKWIFKLKPESQERISHQDTREGWWLISLKLP